MNHLSSSTVRLLTSSQVITSVVSVVKELIENSLDAGSSSIEIILEKNGLDRIEVIDNGCGVDAEGVKCMAQPHFTSKINDVADLESLETYGFRGEALGSLCAMSDVSITTKTKRDEVAMTYTLDKNGCVIHITPSHLPQGTTVSAVHLFQHLPVRRQFYSTKKKLREECKRVEDLVKQFAVIRPEVRFFLKSDKAVVWQKAAVSDHHQALLHVWGSSIMPLLHHINKKNSDLMVNVELFLPKADAPVQAKSEQGFYFVNQRPVVMKEIEKIFKQAYSSARSDDKAKLSFVFCHLQVTPKEIDINLEPNKTKILLHRKDDILQWITEMLQTLIYSQKEQPDENTSKQKSPEAETDSEAIVIKLDERIERKETTDVDASKSFGAEIIELLCDGPFGQTQTEGDAGDWSRGKGVLGKGSSENQPVQLFTPGRKPLATSTQCSSSVTSFLQTTLKTPNGSIDSSTVSNCDKASVALKTPKTSFSMSNTRLSSISRKRKLTEVSTASVLDMLQLSAKKIKSNTPLKLRKSKSISFSMTSVHNAWKNDTYTSRSQEWQTSKQNHHHLLGALKSHGAWIIRSGNCVEIVQPVRAQEALIYQRLMDSHILQSCPLENPLHLTPSLLGEDLWQSLMRTKQSTDSATDPIIHFTDARLSHNGFELQSQPGSQCVDVTCMASCVKHVGISDIKFILQQISEKSDCGLNACRSSKIKHYLQCEATRIARQLPWKLHQDEVKEILSEVKKKLPQEQTACFHARPFKLVIGDLNKFISSEEA